MQNAFRIGRISSVYPKKCTARVLFEDKGKSVSDELAVMVRGSQEAKDYWMPSLGEQVLCVFPSGTTEGYILGTMYNDEDKPPVSSGDKRHLRFEDGGFIEYDSKTHQLIFDFSKVSGATVIFKNCTVIES